jgi:hypothetical protein
MQSAQASRFLDLTRTRGALDDPIRRSLTAVDDFALRWQESLIFAVEKAAAQTSSIEGSNEITRECFGARVRIGL